MIDNTIVQYILTERARGVHDEAIRATLLSNKWREEDISNAFASFVATANQEPRVSPGFSVAYLKYLFAGRVGRFNYFFGGLIVALAYLVITFLFQMSLITFFADLATNRTWLMAIGLFVYVKFAFFTLLSLPLSVRRLHDCGKPGYLAVLTFFPYSAIPFLIILPLLKGNDGANKYGLPEQSAGTLGSAWRAIFKL